MPPPKGLLGVLQTVSSLTDAVDRQSPVIPQDTPRPMLFTWTMDLERVNPDILDLSTSSLLKILIFVGMTLERGSWTDTRYKKPHITKSISIAEVKSL